MANNCLMSISQPSLYELKDLKDPKDLKELKDPNHKL